MNQTRRIWLAGGAAVVAAAAGVAVRKWTRAPIAAESPVQAPASLGTLALPDLDGRTQALSQWRGRVVVVNFWATWCEPCRQEIPGLIRTEKKYSPDKLQMVGIAVDEAAKVRQFATELKIDYPLLIAGMEAIELTQKLGNVSGGLPFTALVNRDGAVVQTHLGQLSEAQLDGLLGPLLAAV